MANQEPVDYVVPVVNEEVHADAVPVETGGVRVVKRVEGHDEIVEQELRKGRVEIKRVAINRPVAGPMQSRREGNTLIVPVVSEVLRVEKQWVLTEEIHLTQLEERQAVRENVQVNQEVAEVQRLDEKGRVVSSSQPVPERGRILAREPQSTEPERQVLTGKNPSMVKNSQKRSI